MLSDFKFYQTHLAIRTHFENNKYDFFQMHGKLAGQTLEAFEARNDRFIVAKICKNPLIQKDPIGFLVANYLNNPSNFAWVGNLAGQDPINVYAKWMALQQSLFYYFKQDVELIHDFKQVLTVVDGSLPELFLLGLQNKVHLETICIIDSIVNFIPYWNKNVKDNIIFPSTSRTIVKYTPFLKFDKVKFKTYLQETFLEEKTEKSFETT